MAILSSLIAASFAAQAQDCTAITPIYQIQGEHAQSPQVGKTITTRGVITQTSKQLTPGFYLQDAKGDQNAATSDGIYVAEPKGQQVGFQPGQEICITAQVNENDGLTQLEPMTWSVLNRQGERPAPVALTLNPGESLGAALERYEGMRVSLNASSDLVLTRPFGFDYSARRHNMALSHQTPLFAPTQKFPEHSEEAQAMGKANQDNQLVVDTDALISGRGFVEIPYFPGLSTQNPISIGDQVAGLTGVITREGKHYRLIPEAGSELVVVKASPKQTQPEIKRSHEGELLVASFNLLNYFTSDAAKGPANPSGKGRGAKTPEGFALQQTKLVNAMLAMDADIIGLLELENNGYGPGSAIVTLVDALNAAQSDKRKHYAFIEPQQQPLDTSPIALGLIYRPAMMKTAGAAELIELPRQEVFKDGKPGKRPKSQRPSLVQTFTSLDGAQSLSLVVSHFKSKGSGCQEDAIGLGSKLQARCNALRVSASDYLADALSKKFDLKHDNLLLLGDFNAYGKEDPLLVLTDTQGVKLRGAVNAFVLNPDKSRTMLNPVDLDKDGYQDAKIITQGYGFININEALHGTDYYSYSFSGQLGSLDHAFASPSLMPMVTEAQDWHINSLENALFSYKGLKTESLQVNDSPFASSDHDPILLKIDWSKKEGGSLGYLLPLLALVAFRRRR